MKLFERSEFTFRSDNELHGLTAHFIKAFERQKPYYPEWILTKQIVDNLFAERRRRLRKILPRFWQSRPPSGR